MMQLNFLWLSGQKQRLCESSDLEFKTTVEDNQNLRNIYPVTTWVNFFSL